MTGLSSVRHLQSLERNVQFRQPPAVNGVTSWLRATIRQRDPVAVVGFCAIGLLLTFAATAWAPDFSATIGDISLIP